MSRISVLQSRVNRADVRRRYWAEQVKNASTISEFTRASATWNAWFQAGVWNEHELELTIEKAKIEVRRMWDTWK